MALTNTVNVLQLVCIIGGQVYKIEEALGDHPQLKASHFIDIDDSCVGKSDVNPRVYGGAIFDKDMVNGPDTKRFMAKGFETHKPIIRSVNITRGGCNEDITIGAEKCGYINVETIGRLKAENIESTIAIIALDARELRLDRLTSGHIYAYLADKITVGYKFSGMIFCGQNTVINGGQKFTRGVIIQRFDTLLKLARVLQQNMTDKFQRVI